MLDVAEYAAKQSENNAAVTASVHCAINAIDAVAVFYLGKRHSVGVHSPLQFHDSPWEGVFAELLELR